MRYRVGTRGSKLALAQTKQVIEKLKSAFPEDEFDVVIIKTTGDMDQKSRLDQIGSKGIFVKEIEEELLEEKIHLAVHSERHARYNGRWINICKGMEAGRSKRCSDLERVSVCGRPSERSCDRNGKQA